MRKKFKDWRDNNLTLKHIKIIMWVVCIIIVIVSLIVEVRVWNSSFLEGNDKSTQICRGACVMLPFLIVGYVEIKLYADVLLSKRYRLNELFVRCKKNEPIEVYLRKKLRRKIKEHDTRYFLTKKEDGLCVVYRKRGKQRKVDCSIKEWKDFELFDSRFTFTKEKE